MCEVYLAALSGRPLQELVPALLERLPPEQRARVLRLRFPADRQRSLCGHLLARSLLCRRLGVDNAALRFSAGEKGKPYLEDYPQTGFNISHTRHCVAVAVGDGEIGVDVEGPRRARRAVAGRFFTPEEARFVFAAEFGCDRRFFYVWTRKEACIKYTGRGLSTPLPSFDVLEGAFAPRLRTFEHGGYTVSACADEPPDTLRTLTEDALLGMAMSLSPYSE